MKSVTTELQTLLASNQFATADLFTLTLLDNSILRHSSAPDFSPVWNAHTYDHKSLVIERGEIRQSIGLEVDNVDVTIYVGATDTLQGLPIPHFVRNGGLDGARLLIQRAFFTIDAYGNLNQTATGVIFSFEGRIAEPKPSRSQVDFQLVADTELLNRNVPRNTITPNCMNTHYDGRCALNKADYSHTSTATSGSTKTVINCNLTQANDYYRLGTLTFTSGANAGVMRTVKKYTTGQLTLAYPLENPPAIGDPFTAVAGCDRTEVNCLSPFNNKANRRVFPFTPVPEQSL